MLLKLINLKNTLALRLTLWYALVFTGSLCLAFTLVYWFMLTVVQAELDEELLEDVAEYVSYWQTGGLAQVREEMLRETQDEGEKSYVRLWTRTGELILASDMSAWPELAQTPPGRMNSTEPWLETVADDNALRRVYHFIAPDILLELGESLDEIEQLMEQLLQALMLALLAVLALSGLIGWFMAHRALRGVKAITRTASEIIAGSLDRRVEVHGQSDELAVLAQTFNQMLDRIQALILGMREMTDNLAHDLRSPLGRLRAAAEMSLSAGHSKTEFEAMAVNTAEECDRLLEMINTTLDIAEAESGAAQLTLTELDLVKLVRDAIELFQPLADEKNVTLVAHLPDTCLLQADRQRLQRVIANLIDNALKYSRPGGQVIIRLDQNEQQIKVTIEDTGIGISSGELRRIFERYYRCDRSRSEHGNGLGLSLARAFARVHGGDIEVSSELNQGSTFTTILARSL